MKIGIISIGILMLVIIYLLIYLSPPSINKKTITQIRTYVDKSSGISNNNPGNIKFNSSNQWKGQTGRDLRGFAKFSDPVWGIRATSKLLRNYQKIHGLDTIQKIIDRWAPSHENDTNAYIKHVASVLNIMPTKQISLEDKETMKTLVKIIITHENGTNPYSDRLISESIDMAYQTGSPMSH